MICSMFRLLSGDEITMPQVIREGNPSSNHFDIFLQIITRLASQRGNTGQFLALHPFQKRATGGRDVGEGL